MQYLNVHFLEGCGFTYSVQAADPHREVRLDLIDLDDEIHLGRKLFYNELPFLLQRWSTAPLNELLDHLNHPAKLLDRNAVVSDAGLISRHLELARKLVLHLLGWIVSIIILIIWGSPLLLFFFVKTRARKSKNVVPVHFLFGAKIEYTNRAVLFANVIQLAA